MYNKIKREILTIAILLNRILCRTQVVGENFGHWFFNVVLYRGRPGYVEFNLDTEYDGHVVHRVTQRQVREDVGAEVRTQVLDRMTYRITNRWLVRNGRVPNMEALWAIATQAQISEGLNVVEVVHGHEAYRQTKVRPFDVSHLPEQEILDRRNSRRLWLQNFMARMFPVPVRDNSDLLDEMRATIIKRV